MRDIIKKIKDYASDGVSLNDLSCFVGMIETGEATISDFEECGIDLEQIARRFGSANCWTGTSGKYARQLFETVKEWKAKQTSH